MRVLRVSYQHCAREGALPLPNSLHRFPKVTPLLALSFAMKWWNNVAGSPEKATEGNVGTAGSWNPHPTHRNAFQKQAVCSASASTWNWVWVLGAKSLRAASLCPVLSTSKAEILPWPDQSSSVSRASHPNTEILLEIPTTINSRFISYERFQAFI